MKKLINNINEYLEVTVQTKKNMKERIYQLEKDVKEARDNEKYALEQMNKYKKKLHEEKKKIKTGKIWEETLEKKKYCVDCGIEINKRSERCSACANKFKTSQNILPVTREELKNLIRNKPFTQIGSDFCVTDNAIRKWCDKFNLPRTKKEINSYDDAEWSKV